MQEQGRIGSAAVGRVGAYQRWYEQQELPEVVAPCVRELLNAYKVTVASAKGLRSALLRLSAFTGHPRGFTG